MNKTELLEKNGEDSFTQFKLNITKSESLANEFVAFANAKGGYLIVGVDDNKQIIGLTDKDISQLNLLIANVASQNVKPPIYPISEVIAIDDKKIVLINIEQGSDKRKISREELKILFAHSGSFFSDETVNVKSNIDDIDQQKFYPMFNIQAIYCKSNTIHNSYVDKKYFQGSIYSLFEQAMMFLYSYLRSIQDKETFN